MPFATKLITTTICKYTTPKPQCPYTVTDTCVSKDIFYWPILLLSITTTIQHEGYLSYAKMGNSNWSTVKQCGLTTFVLGKDVIYNYI